MKRILFSKEYYKKNMAFILAVLKNAVPNCSNFFEDFREKDHLWLEKEGMLKDGVLLVDPETIINSDKHKKFVLEHWERLNTQEVKDYLKKCLINMEYARIDKLTYEDKSKRITTNLKELDRHEVYLKSKKEPLPEFEELLQELFNKELKILPYEKDLKIDVEKGLKTNVIKEKVLCSYCWLSNPDVELKTLFKLMHDDYKLIAPETTLEQFKSIFTEQPIETINPIKWTTNNNLLAYFIDQIYSTRKIGSDNLKMWKIAEHCFQIKSLAQSKDNYLNNKKGKPKRYEIIDTIIYSL